MSVVAISKKAASSPKRRHCTYGTRVAFVTAVILSWGVTLAIPLSPKALASTLPDTVPSDASAQNELFTRLRQAPTTDNEQIISWIKTHQLEVNPLFLLELSQRLLPKNPTEALEWYVIGAARARYDAQRCVDPSAEAGVMFLSSYAPETAQYAAQHIEAYAAAGSEAVERDDLFSSAASPQWICIHGMSSFTGEGGGIKAQGEWPAVADKIRAMYHEGYREVAKPVTADLPLTPVPVYKLPNGAEGSDMSWLNSDILAVGVANAKMKDIYFWDVKTRTATLAASSANLWCAADNQFTYAKTYQQIGKNFRFTLVRQEPSGQRELATGDLTPPLPIFKKIPMLTYGYNPDMNKGTEKFNPFDCSWTSSKELAASYPSYAWEYLRPGDGAIAFKSDPKNKGVHPQMTAVHYKADSNAPVTLPITSIGLDITRVSYYEFRKAYFLTVPEISTDRDTNRCQSAWWFKPAGDRVEQVCAPVEALAKQDMSYVPSKKGILRFIAVRETTRGLMTGGVYLTDDNGQTTKIWEGMAYNGITSPDGCLVAISSAPPLVLDLCN